MASLQQPGCAGAVCPDFRERKTSSESATVGLPQPFVALADAKEADERAANNVTLVHDQAASAVP